MIVRCWKIEEAVEFEGRDNFNSCFFIRGEVQIERHFLDGSALIYGSGVVGIDKQIRRGAALD